MPAPSIIPKPVSEYDLRLLKVFVAVVENQGFAAAANALGITRSTVSLHMSNLETRLGYTLCFRGRGGFSLTEEGREVYQAVTKLFQSFTDFSFLIGSLGQELSGELVILCADQLDANKQRKLGEVIRLLNDECPKLSVVLDGASIFNIEKQLLDDKAHIGLYPAYHELDGLEYQSIFSESIYLCCSNEHPFFDKTDTQITEDMLEQALAIHPGIDIDPEGRQQLSKLNLAAKSYQFDTRKAMILSGRYIGYLPQSFIQQELNRGEMRIIKPNQCNYNFHLSLANKRNPKEEKKVSLLTRIFSEVFSDKS